MMSINLSASVVSRSILMPFSTKYVHANNMVRLFLHCVFFLDSLPRRERTDRLAGPTRGVSVDSSNRTSVPTTSTLGPGYVFNVNRVTSFWQNMKYLRWIREGRAGGRLK